MFNQSRRRLAYWFALSMGSILVLFAFAVYYRQVQDQLRAFDSSLYAASQRLAAKAAYSLEGGQWQVELNLPLQNESSSMLEKIAYIRWYSATGKLLQFTDSAPPKWLTKATGFQTLSYSAPQATQKLRQLTLPVKQERMLIGYLQVAAPLELTKANLARTRLFLALGVPATLGLVGIVGWFLGGMAMQPTRRSYEQLQRFTADASHELRAPIAAILSNAQVGLLSNESTQQRQRLENIVGTTKSMSSLISNLLFLARHEGRLGPEVIKAVDLPNLLQPLPQEYAALAKEKQLNFYLHLPSKPITLNGDPELLLQAVRNLLDNACKYTSPGGTVWLRLLSQPRRALIQVEDTGIGIPKADLPHIFERFYRVDTARSRALGGSGLGLAIVEQIVQAHGGQIGVKSTLGQSTTFEIVFPLR